MAEIPKAPFAGDLQEQFKQLRPSTTLVTHRDGSQVKETRGTSTAAEGGYGGGSHVTVEAVSGPSVSPGFVVDQTEFDVKLGNPVEGLYIGSCDVAADREMLRSYRITHIINAAMSLKDSYRDDKTLTYLSLPLYDSTDEDIQQYFDATNKFINHCLCRGGSVLVHCVAGVSRSSTIAMAYLIKEREMTPKAALELIRETRWVRPNDGFMMQLCQYHRRLYPTP